MKEQGKVNIKKLANELDITYSSCYRIIRQWNEYVNTEINNKMYK